MKRPALQTIEKKQSLSDELILIVDKQGFIGSRIILELKKQAKEIQIVFVSQNATELQGDRAQNVLFVPYRKKIPIIPNGNYSYMFIIYDGEEETMDAISAFITKAKQVNAKLVFSLPLALYSKSIVDSIIDDYSGAYVVCLGDLFGKDARLKTPMNHLLAQAKKGHVVISNMGLVFMHTVFIDDVVSGILEAAFGGDITTRVFFLFPKHPPTMLGVVRMIQRVDPVIHIEFKSLHMAEKDREIPKEGRYLLPDTYPLQERIRSSLLSLPADNKQIDKNLRVYKNAPLPVKIPPFSILYFLFSVLLLPIVVTILFLLLGVKQLETSKVALQTGSLVGAARSAKGAQSFFTIAQNAAEVFVLEASVVGQKEIALKPLNSARQGRELAFLLTSFLDALQRFSENDFAIGASELKNALTLFQKTRIEGEMLTEKISFSPDKVSAIVDVLPEILGFAGKKEYLVLFQNNMELRPGGGFIGSYGLLTLDKGKVLEFSINDVYDADGQLKGHVEPPFPIRRYLPSEHWYMRDSNFFADFQKSASSAATFLKLEKDRVVDGVIGIDVSFVRKLLEVVGPISVSDYNEVVNAENVHMLTQKHAARDFFPGSSQKKDFLRSLFNALSENLAARSQLPYIQIVAALQDALLQKHILFAFSQSSIQNVFTANGLSSSLWDSREDSNDAINDFIGLSEANLGVNKANYFVRRNIQYTAALNSEGNVSGKVIITYHNTSKTDSTFGGDYKNYLSVLLPLGVTLSAVTIDEKEQSIVPAVTDPAVYEAKNFTPPKELEIEETQEGNKKIVGFLFIVPKGAVKTVSLSYTQTLKISPDAPAVTYRLNSFKQPGTESDPFSFSFSYPDTFRVFKLTDSSLPSHEFRQSGQTVSLSTTLDHDKDFTVQLSKK